MKKHFNTFFGVLLKLTKLTKVIKAIKVFKPLISVLTMVLSVVAYSPMFGFKFALFFVVLILLHEMGHVFALKKLGYPMKLPIFIPFLGAVIFAPQFNDRHKEAIVGIGGPILGTIAALFCLIPYYYTSDLLWASLALVGVYINAFNMIPVSPLDGGRITQAVHKNFKWVGILALLYFTLNSKDAGMLVLWILILMDLKLTAKSKFIYMFLLFALMLILGFGFGFKHYMYAFLIDITLALMFLLLVLVDYRTTKSLEKIRKDAAEYGITDLPAYEPTIKIDDRPLLTKKERLNWAMGYFLLLTIQIFTIVYLFQLIKK